MYRLAKGVYIKSSGIIIDERLDISYDNEILTRYLLDIDHGDVDDFGMYFKNLNVKDYNKYIVKNCMNFYFKNSLIEKNVFLLNHVIWFRSRVKMLMKLLSMMSMWALPVIFLSLLIQAYDIYGISFLLQFFYIHLLSIYIHESMHAILYWLCQNEVNGLLFGLK